MPLRPDLTMLAARFDGPPVTRFAPSPTGHLHLGHVVNAIYTWGIARALGGRVIVRIEDHDRIRSRPAFDAALLEDLTWLGFIDSASTIVIRQSDEDEAYAAAFDRLCRAHQVYACDCSRKDIGGERYPGTCRTAARTIESWGPPSGGPARAQRVTHTGFRVAIARTTERFDDGLLGPQVQHPADEFGDILVRDRDGHWTYQFAVATDDIRHGITLIVRGADLLSSTGRQLLLARMLGRAVPPVFLHHPLLLGPDGEKLSKSRGDTGVCELREQGVPAPDVIGRAAAAVGLIHVSQPVLAGDVQDLFTGHSGGAPS